MLARAKALEAQHGATLVDFDYFIGFPCMHIAHPVIATFFVAKRWNRMATALVVYNAVLIPAFVLLECIT